MQLLRKDVMGHWIDVDWQPLSENWFLVTHQDITQAVKLQHQHQVVHLVHSDAVLLVRGSQWSDPGRFEKVLGYTHNEFAHLVLQDMGRWLEAFGVDGLASRSVWAPWWFGNS